MSDNVHPDVLVLKQLLSNILRHVGSKYRDVSVKLHEIRIGIVYSE